MGVALDAHLRQVERVGLAAGGRDRLRPLDRVGGDARPHRVLVDVVAPHDQMRHALELRGIGLRRVGRAGRLDRDQRLHLVGRVERGGEAEVAALAVHHDDARAHLLHQRVIGLLRRGVVGRPARNALLAELVERLDRELLALERLALAADFVRRPDAEQLPRFLLGAEERLALEDLRIARPRGAAALDRVGDVGVVAGVEEELLPARLAVRLGLPRHAGQSAAVPQQQRHAALRLRQLHVLHVHLLDFELAVRIDLQRRRAGREHDFLGGQSAQRLGASADVEAADFLDHVVGGGGRRRGKHRRDRKRDGAHEFLPRVVGRSVSAALGAALSRVGCGDRAPDQQPLLDRRDRHVDHDDEHREHEHAGEHARDVEHALGLLDDVAEARGRAEIFADHRADHRKADRGVQRGEHPGERRGPVHVAHQLPLAHAEHARVGEHRRAHFLHALIDVEEHDEEHQRDAERDLRGDAEPEPEREDRRQHDARQRVDHLHVRVEHRVDRRLAGEPEADQHAAERADHEGEDRLDQRDPQMLPDRALDEPFDHARRDVARRREEERRQQHRAVLLEAEIGQAADRILGEHVPERDRHDRDEDLQREKRRAAHDHPPPVC